MSPGRQRAPFLPGLSPPGRPASSSPPSPRCSHPHPATFSSRPTHSTPGGPFSGPGAPRREEGGRRWLPKGQPGEPPRRTKFPRRREVGTGTPQRALMRRRTLETPPFPPPPARRPPPPPQRKKGEERGRERVGRRKWQPMGTGSHGTTATRITEPKPKEKTFIGKT